ncbi:MAG TPA: zinc-dependent peptidase, partial [Gemmata sp.]|nr:zinc-dependent peptidase [Gemmata sp.]
TPVAEDDWEDDGLSERPLAGQAWERGHVILAWDQVLAEARVPEAGNNVVVHEFAHQLDYVDGLSSGTPVLGDREIEKRWRYALAVAFEDHRRAIREHRDTLFTTHAADSEAEFFADATEAFYCRSTSLKERHPELYELLGAYYRIDPAAWFRGRAVVR